MTTCASETHTKRTMCVIMTINITAHPFLHAARNVLVYACRIRIPSTENVRLKSKRSHHMM